MNIKQFKIEFSKELENTGKERISRNNVFKHFRRLDSIARLLEGNSVCAAVYYHEPSKQIWIANNQVHANSRAMNQSIEQINNTFNLISDESLDIMTIIDTLTVPIYLNLCQENRFTIKREEWLSKKIKKYLTELFESGNPTKQWCEKKLQRIEGKENEKLLSIIIKVTARLTRDFLKIRRFLLEDKNNSLAKNITSSIRKRSFIVLHIEGKNVHAEIRLLAEKMKKQEDLKETYFGISKLCCNHCAMALKNFKVASRGLHGKPFNWEIPSFFHKEDALTTFFGPSLTKSWTTLNIREKKEAKAYIQTKESGTLKNKKNRSMKADSSESDDKFGINCSSESLEEELPNWPLENVWNLADFKQYNSAEYMRLQDMGASQEDILALARDPEKLSTFAHEVVNFFDGILPESECSERYDVFYEIFYDLYNLYDTDYDFFWIILNSPKELKQVFTYTQLKDQLYKNYHKDNLQFYDIYSELEWPDDVDIDYLYWELIVNNETTLENDYATKALLKLADLAQSNEQAIRYLLMSLIHQSRRIKYIAKAELYSLYPKDKLLVFLFNYLLEDEAYISRDYKRPALKLLTEIIIQLMVNNEQDIKGVNALKNAIEDANSNTFKLVRQLLKGLNSYQKFSFIEWQPQAISISDLLIRIGEIQQENMELEAEKNKAVLFIQGGKDRSSFLNYLPGNIKSIIACTFFAVAKKNIGQNNSQIIQNFLERNPRLS